MIYENNLNMKYLIFVWDSSINKEVSVEVTDAKDFYHARAAAYRHVYKTVDNLKELAIPLDGGCWPLDYTADVSIDGSNVVLD